MPYELAFVKASSLKLSSPQLLDGEGEQDKYHDELVELLRLRQLLTTDPDIGQPQPEPERDRWYDMTLDEARRIPNPIASKQAVEAIMARDAGEYIEPQIEDTAHRTYYELLAKTRALADQLDAELNYPHPPTPSRQASPPPSPLPAAQGGGARSEHGYFSDLARVRPFHWGIEFPEVFYNADGTPKENPGFTIIFGNPPWEIVKPEFREFYSQFDERIKSKMNRQQMDARIAELDVEDSRRRPEFEAQARLAEDMSAYVRHSQDYTHQGAGDIATHKLFLERMYSLLGMGGRLGYVLPSGVYLDLGTKELREMLLDEGNIQYIFSFSNERFFFSGVDHRFKFALVGAQKGQQSEGFWSAFRFNPRVAIQPEDLPDFLRNKENLIYVKGSSISRFSPDSLGILEFQSQHDVDVAEKIYSNHPSLGQIIDGEWNVRFTREINNTSDMILLNTTGYGIPLHEGKMINQFEAYFAKNQYWIDPDLARQRLSVEGNSQIDADFYRIANRRQAVSTNARTMIACIIPPGTFCWDSLAVTVMRDKTGKQQIDEPQLCYLVSIMNSFVFDYVLRQQIGTNLAFYLIYQLPMPRLTAGNPYFDAIVPRAARLTCTRAEFAGLWEAVMGEQWDQSKGVVDPAERQKVRDEIDALVAHLYGLSRDEYDHILGTFPLVFPDNEAGQARRAAALAAYDQTRP